jgi:hypothetical protein
MALVEDALRRGLIVHGVELALREHGASDAAWIMLNDVMPSGNTPHSSPSR